VRSSLRYASKKYWNALAKDLRQIYTAPTEQAAEQRFADFTADWGERYPAINGDCTEDRVGEVVIRKAGAFAPAGKDHL
jgi:transposase-like protein